MASNIMPLIYHILFFALRSLDEPDYCLLYSAVIGLITWANCHMTLSYITLYHPQQLHAVSCSYLHADTCMYLILVDNNQILL